MGMGVVNSLVVATGIFLVFWAWKVFNSLWLTPKRLERFLRKQGFSGSSYRLYGGTKEESKMIREALSSPIKFTDDILPRIGPLYHKDMKTYGKKLFVWRGFKPSLVMTDPEQIREIMKKNFDFTKPRLNPLLRLFATGVIDYEGEKWVKHRKLMNPAFRIQKLRDMIPAFHSSTSEMIAKWENIVAKQGGTSELDIWKDLKAMTGDVISRTTFGVNYEEGQRVFKLILEIAQLTLSTANSVYIPGSRFLPTAKYTRIRQVDSEIDSILSDIITRRMKQMKAGDSNSDDLLGMLLESNFKEIESHGKSAGMSIKEMIAECRIFYFAGQETTATLFAWTMILLSKHQHWQEKARQEVLEVFGNNEPTTEGLSHLKIVTMILNEVLRFYPPSPFLIRTVSEDTKLGQVVVPAGAEISIPIVKVHTDCEIWGDDAKEFNPGRFSEGISKATELQHVAYFPFGWGPRICVGQNFVLLEAKLAMAMILQRFTFELSPLYIHAPCTITTMQPQHGAHLILHKRC